MDTLVLILVSHLFSRRSASFPFVGVGVCIATYEDCVDGVSRARITAHDETPASNGRCEYHLFPRHMGSTLKPNKLVKFALTTQVAESLEDGDSRAPKGTERFLRVAQFALKSVLSARRPARTAFFFSPVYREVC